MVTRRPRNSQPPQRTDYENRYFAVHPDDWSDQGAPSKSGIDYGGYSGTRTRMGVTKESMEENLHDYGIDIEGRDLDHLEDDNEYKKEISKRHDTLQSWIANYAHGEHGIRGEWRFIQPHQANHTEYSPNGSERQNKNYRAPYESYPEK